MPLLVGELYALLTVEKKQFEAGLAAAKVEATGASRSIGDSLASAGKMIAVGLGVAAVAVAGIGFESIKAATEFQSAMELIQTQAGASTKEVHDMTQGILDMAGAVGTAPDKLAEGIYHIESAGIRGAKALEVLKTAALGAKIGNADLEAVTNALVAEVNSGIGGVNGMSDAMGVLNGIVGNGNMRMNDLAESMSTGILSVAKTFGITIQSVGAALATMTDQGVPATDAATKIKTAIISMAAPIGATKKAFESIGLGTRDLATELASPRGIVGALALLKGHMDAAGLDAIEQGQLIAQAFGKRGGPAVMTLLNSLETVATKEGAIADQGGKFAESVGHLMQEVSFKADQVGASLGVIAIQIGSALLPAVSAALDAVQGFLTGGGIQAAFATVAAAFEILSKAAGGVVDALSTVWKVLGDLGMQGPVIAAAIGLIVVAFGAWAIAAGAAAVATIAATWPILAVIALVALAIRGVQLIFETMGWHVEDVMKGVGDAIGAFGDIVSGVFAWVGKTVKDFAQAFLSLLGTIANVMSMIPGPTQDAANQVKAALDRMHDDVAGWGDDTAAVARDAADSVGVAFAVGAQDWQNDLATRMAHAGTAMGDAASTAGSDAGGRLTADMLKSLTSGQKLTDEQMKSMGLSSTVALAAGVDDGSGVVMDQTKSLVERFGTSLQDVVDASKVAGGAAMAQMAQGITDARKAPLDAFDTLKTMLKNAMDPAQENARLIGELISKELAKGLHSKDPAVRAQAIATKQLILDRLNEIAASGAPLGKKAMEELRKGIKSKDKDIHAAALAAQAAALGPLHALAGKAGAAGQAAGKSFANGFAQEVVAFGSSIALRISRSKGGGPVLGGTYASGAWKIPHDQLAFIHQGEMVVPAAAAQRFRDAATAPSSVGAGPGGMSGPVIGNMYLTINPGSDVSGSAAQRFGQNVLDVVAGGLREQRARTA